MVSNRKRHFSRFVAKQKHHSLKPKVDWNSYGISEFDPDINQTAGISAGGKKIRLGLVAVGLGLMLGLFSRWACLGGMLLLGMYYLASPPFIGLENSALTEGNYLIVNKNLIELFALWVLFLFRDSRYYGMDRLLKRPA